MKKVFLSIGLACLALNLEPAALRQAARVGLFARAGALRTVQPVHRALQTLRAISTTPQNKFFKKDSGKDWAILIGGSIGALGVLGYVDRLISDNKQKGGLFNELSQLIQAINADTSDYKVYERVVHELVDIWGQLSKQQRDDLSTKFIERLLEYRLANGHFDLEYYSLASLLKNIASKDTRDILACRLLENSKKFNRFFSLYYLVSHVKDLGLRNKWVVDFLESMSFGISDLFYVVGCLKHLAPQDADAVARKILELVLLYQQRVKDGLLNVGGYSGSEFVFEQVIENAISFIGDVSDKRRFMSHLLGHTDLFLANTSCVQEYPFFGEVNVVGDIGQNISWLMFDRNRSSGNFNHLLPLVAEYVAHEYKQDNIVYFHAQNSQFIFLTHVYEAFEVMQRGTEFPEDFIPFRFTKKCPIFNLKDVVKVGLHGYDAGPVREWILFANLHLGANPVDMGSNTAHYIVHNYDQSVVTGRLETQKKLTDLFNDYGLSEELEKFADDIKYVQNLFDEAIKDQGNYGRLIVISMPKKTASEISYMAHPGGTIKKRKIDGLETADPVKWAAHYAECGLDNEVCICLDDILDPEKAKNAGIKMKAFDPAIYWETEKAEKYKAALKDLMARMQASYEARKAQENSKE